MRRILAAIAALCFAVSGLAVNAPPAAASICNGQSYLIIYEDINYSSQQQQKLICYGTNIPYLKNFEEPFSSQGGTCNGALWFNGTWDQCISSLKFTRVVNWQKVCLYTYENYSLAAGGGGFRLLSSVNMPNVNPYNDDFRSIRWNGGNC